MATEQELMELQDSLRPMIEDAIARGEDLSTPEHLERFILRVLEQNGFVLRGDTLVEAIN